jgi:hypothetical protein
VSVGRIRQFIANTAQNVKDLFALHFSPEAKSERLQRSYGLDDTRSWVDPNGYRLSDRIWQQRRKVRAKIDQELRRAIAEGQDAATLATALEQYLTPSARPILGVAGDLLSGGGSYPARRLARTEISRAHAAATEWAAARNPFAVGTKWNLSAAHPAPDECDVHAGSDNGLGPGVYRPGDFPTMPAHPNCLCYASTEVEKDTRAVIAALRETYGLDDE